MLALKTNYSLRTTVAVKTSSIEAFGVGRTSYPVASFPEDLALFSLSCPQWQTPFPGFVFDRLTNSTIHRASVKNYQGHLFNIAAIQYSSTNGTNKRLTKKLQGKTGK